MDESEPSPTSSAGPSPQLVGQERPRSAGRPNEPLPAAMLHAHRIESLHSRPRNRSPYSRSHLRSYSAASALSAPPMARTRSLPNPAAGFSISPSHSPVRPSSPLRSPVATRPSPRRSFEDAHSLSAATPSFKDIEIIAEDSELDITPRPFPSSDYSAATVPFSPSHTHHRSSSANRRRPASPLHSLNQSPVSLSSPLSSYSTPVSLSSPFNEPSPASTPPLSSTRFNEAYPATTTTPQLSLTTPTAYSNSSIPSTPTSLRSRSPSISSLETIPDSPDAEEAAMEAFNIARLRAAAEAADSTGSDSDGEPRRSRSTVSAGSKATPAAEKNRKRWSVCGAERRGDFEMETIWED